MPCCCAEAKASESASSVVALPDERELRLTAEAAAGRRNKIVTVLVEPMGPVKPPEEEKPE